MMGVDEKVAAFDKAIGLTTEDTFTNTPLPGGIPSEEITGRLGEIEKGNAPEPPKLNGSQGATETAEELKGIESDLNLPYKTQDDTDYKAKLKEEYGIEADVANRTEYEKQAFQIYHRQEYLSQYDIAGAQAIIDGKIAKDTVLQSVVERDLKASKVFSNRLYEEQMSELVKEGQLTPEGEKRYSEIVEEQKSLLDKTLKAADKYAEGKLKEFDTHDAALEAALKVFKPMGIEMSDEWRGHIEDVIRGGQLSDFINNAKTHEEYVEREMWMALAASPKARADLFKSIFEKGIKHGVAQKATRLFN